MEDYEGREVSDKDVWGRGLHLTATQRLALDKFRDSFVAMSRLLVTEWRKADYEGLDWPQSEEAEHRHENRKQARRKIELERLRAKRGRVAYAMRSYGRWVNEMREEGHDV